MEYNVYWVILEYNCVYCKPGMWTVNDEAVKSLLCSFFAFHIISYVQLSHFNEQ